MYVADLRAKPLEDRIEELIQEKYGESILKKCRRMEAMSGISLRMLAERRKCPMWSRPKKRIKMRGKDTVQFYDGQVSMLTKFNRDLTDEEVQQLHELLMAGRDPTDLIPGCTEHYNFDEATPNEDTKEPTNEQG
jgi:hypothetical protein